MKITKLETKQTKTGKDYLALEYDGKKLNYFTTENFWVLQNAFNDGIDINIAVAKEGNFWNVVSIDGAASPIPKKTNRIERAMDVKNERIEKSMDRKENSIIEAAIRRDSAIFTSVCWEGFGGDKNTDVVKNAHKYWTDYFRELYQ